MRVVIEPCVMCSGYWSSSDSPDLRATNQKFGEQVVSTADERLNWVGETGILEAECAVIMQTFFRRGRERKKQAKLAAKVETQE